MGIMGYEKKKTILLKKKNTCQVYQKHGQNQNAQRVGPCDKK